MDTNSGVRNPLDPQVNQQTNLDQENPVLKSEVPITSDKINNQPLGRLPIQTKTPKLPWSWLSVLLFSVIFNLPGSYLIVWQNLKRLGKEEEARRFFIIGGILIIVIVFLLGFLPPTDSSLEIGLGTGLSLMFPVWLYTKYLGQWQKENVGKARFSWSIIGWGLLGLIIWLLLTAVLYLIST